MSRQVRIEYEGALYHVMARGNRRNRIFVSPDGGDEILFLRTLGECCACTGFRIWAWVLVGNHYHLLLETPAANLVEGMGWLQNTYTRRFNSRHRAWGRLFGDRYPSVLVEPGGSGGDLSLRTLLDYIHLNPVRSGWLPSGSGGLLDYPWSSLARAYALSPGKREAWMAVSEGLSLFQCADRAADRRRFVERLEARRMTEAAKKCGLSNIEGQTLQSTLRKGWYWGGEAFKESLLEKLDRLKKGALPVSRAFRSSRQARDHAQRGAEAILAEAVAHFGLEGGSRSDFEALPRGDVRRVATAWALCRRTSMKQTWIADRIGMRSAGNVSVQVGRFNQQSSSERSREIRRWVKKFS